MTKKALRAKLSQARRNARRWRKRAQEAEKGLEYEVNKARKEATQGVLAALANGVISIDYDAMPYEGKAVVEMHFPQGYQPKQKPAEQQLHPPSGGTNVALPRHITTWKDTAT